MKRTVTAILLLLSLFMLLPHAHAQTVFMVQFGTFDSEPEARKHWDTISGALPDLFQELQQELQYVSSEKVMQPDNFVSYRTQAGPIATRNDAEEICNNVVRAGYGCYVAETAMFVGDDAAVQSSGVIASNPALSPFAPEEDISLSPAAPQTYVPQDPVNVAELPVASVSVPVIPVAQLPEANFTSPSAPPAPNGMGTIAVEEAIPVPLSAVEPRSNPYLERGNHLMYASPSDSSRVQSFWADIGYFTTDTAAAQYVRVLKMRDSLLPKKLRIRIVRPYGHAHRTQRLTLRMGPFVTTRPIRRLCALTRPERLRCRAIKDLGGSVQKSSHRTFLETVNRYKQKARYTQHNKQHSNMTAERFYVQLGSFLSPRAAENKWQELRTRHAGILPQNTKEIMTPRRSNASSSRLFRLRSGPYDSVSKANNVCGRLKAAGTLCVVVKR
ncbi:MAG: hypothetical protein F6K62_11055 [Sphaerospermopsis sp. SIO1G2]|nr:hypothetical protein [Sphaerospermopsis sp. SIO1G2]